MGGSAPTLSKILGASKLLIWGGGGIPPSLTLDTTLQTENIKLPQTGMT